jgi:hypothetical protein
LNVLPESEKQHYRKKYLKREASGASKSDRERSLLITLWKILTLTYDITSMWG